MTRAGFRSLLSDPIGCDRPILVDVGTSSLTAVRAVARPDLRRELLAQPVMETLALSAADCARLGSDCVRAGFLFAGADPEQETFTDAYGVEWLRVDGVATPVRHPLEDATLAQIVKHPRPEWPKLIQVPEEDARDRIIVADAPCPGMLDMSFALRNAWGCLEDMTSNWQSISALLDWSLETIVEAYERMLGGLPVAPDIVVYGDDLGFQQSMFISEVDFRTFVRPRMRTLFSRLRRLTDASLCFHSCGAIRPIVSDLCDLGIDIFNFDGDARGMICTEVRREVPRKLIFHGCSNLTALGCAVREGNLASVAVLTTEIVESMPVIAAPMDNIYSARDVDDARMGACFLRQLSPDDLAAISRLGPVRAIVENGVSRAQATEFSDLTGEAPACIATAPLANVEHFSSADATRSASGTQTLQ